MDQNPEHYNRKLIEDLLSIKILIEESNEQGESFD